MARTAKTGKTGKTERTGRTARIAPSRNQPIAMDDGPTISITAEVASGAVLPGKVIPIPSNINVGLSSAKNSTMLQVLGMPRDSIDHKCRGVINEPMRSLVVTQDVGPFRVTGVIPAVASLEGVFRSVGLDHPEILDLITSAGMLCVRKIKNSSRLSNHSWGCAIDIRMDGVLDGLGSGRRDGKTLAGLAAMAPFFNAAGWYWGVGFSTFEDGMHFEVADETIRKWHADGAFGPEASVRRIAASNMSIGDKGAEVADLQRALASRGFDIIPDGDFGLITRGIVMDFQASNELEPDGIVGPATKTALGLT